LRVKVLVVVMLMMMCGVTVIAHDLLALPPMYHWGTADFHCGSYQSCFAFSLQGFCL
jgi:hypothetical protein